LTDAADIDTGANELGCNLKVRAVVFDIGRNGVGRNSHVKIFRDRSIDW